MNYIAKFGRTATLSAVLLLGAFTAASAQSSASEMVPEAVQERGTLRVAMAFLGPPMAFLGDDARTPQGLEVDLTRAVGEQLGLEVEFTPSTFDSLIPSITSERADIAAGSLGDLKSRLPQVDFVDYVEAGISLAVLQGNPKGISDLPSLCGNSVAVLRGTFNEQELMDQKAKCEEEGSDLDVQTFGESNAALLAVRSGRADALWHDSAPTAYAVSRSEGTLEMAGEGQPIALIGYAFNKDNTELRDAVKAALEELLANGRYQEIFKDWGQEPTMLDEITINNAWL